MKTQIRANAVYARPDDVVARPVAGETVLIPIACGEGSAGDPYFLNGSAQAIWQRLDGRASLRQIVKELSSEFDASPRAMAQDVKGFVRDLLKRKLILEVRGA